MKHRVLPRVILLAACAYPALAPAADQAPAPKPAAAAEPAPTAGDAAPAVVPARADEGPTTVGPLPVRKDAPPAGGDDLTADDSPHTVGLDPDEPLDMGATLFKTLLVLGVIVVLIYISLNFGLRRLMGIRGVPAGKSALVQVVERIPLDPKRTLFVLRAAGEYLLVGGTDTGLQLITRLDADEVTRLIDQSRREAAASSPFLQKLLSKKDPPPGESEKP